MKTNDYKGVFFSLFTSILIHFLVVIFFFINKNEIEKITVLDLATFRENTLVNQLNNQKFLKKIPYIEKKFDLEKPKKINEKKYKKKQDFDSNLKSKIKNIENNREEDRLDNKSEEQSNNNVEKEQSKKPSNISPPSISSKAKIIQDKALFDYLTKFSKKLNILATNSYPKQSRKRKEQGVIYVKIVVDNLGRITSYEINTKRPKRLAESARLLLSKNRDLGIVPPQHMFEKEKFLVFEVKIIYKMF